MVSDVAFNEITNALSPSCPFPFGGWIGAEFNTRKHRLRCAPRLIGVKFGQIANNNAPLLRCATSADTVLDQPRAGRSIAAFRRWRNSQSKAGNISIIENRALRHRWKRSHATSRERGDRHSGPSVLFLVGTWSAPFAQSRYSARNRPTRKTLDLKGKLQATPSPDNACRLY
jgi:hypothetical protein